MHHAIWNDRLWFQRHPKAIVRFRPYAPGEFAPLERERKDPPFFRPSFSNTKSVLSWVAVVDLMHLLGANTTSDPSSSCARVRLRTPALPNIHDRQKAEKELIEAVATELLNQAKINSSDNDVNPNKYQINQPEYSNWIAA